MTASAKSIKGSPQGVDYLIAEHKGYELDRNLIHGETSKEIMDSFKIQQENNSNCDKKFITAYISPDPKDGQKLTDKEFKEISHDFMKGIGINPEKQAYLAIVHTEKNHKHVHLLINRIDENNKAIKDNFIVLKAQNTAHKIAKERGLTSARDIMHKNQESKIMQSKEIKKQIFEAHSQVMKIKPQTFSKYMQYMKALGHEIKPTINKKGDLQGFRVDDKKSGKEFKMSEIKREMSANNLAKELKYDLDYKFNSTLDNSRKKQLEIAENKGKSQDVRIN